MPSRPSSSWIAHAQRDPPGRPWAARPPRLQRSADASTACRLRSSSRQRGFGCSSRSPSRPPRARLDVVGGSVPDLPARQRTLTATIDWSYELLADDRACRLRASRDLRRWLDLAAGRGGLPGRVVGDVLDERSSASPSTASSSRGVGSSGRRRECGCWRRSANTRRYDSTRAARCGDASRPPCRVLRRLR